MEIMFWGVRGSVPVPGPKTEGVGGNTSCVEVRAGGQRIVLDAGTGLRGLGDTLVQGPASQLTLLLSHMHWDHIQGIPFFGPLYRPDTQLDIYAAPTDGLHTQQALEHQMRPPVFPVPWSEVPAQVRCHDLTPGRSFSLGPVRVQALRVNHPGGVMAFRLEHAGRSVVYATDTEHYSCVDPNLLRLCLGADVLIYDSQYTPEEYAGISGPPRVGWGHSTWRAASELAREADVGKLVLFHHDPARDDAGVAEIECRARECFAGTEAAREGRCLTLPELERSQPQVAVAP